MKKILSLIIISMMLLAVLPVSAATEPALFTEFLPDRTVEAPRSPYVKLERDEGGDFGDCLDFWCLVPTVFREITTAAQKWDEENDGAGEVARNRFGVEWYAFDLQIDGRIDGGSWQYNSDWDDPDIITYIDGVEPACFSAHVDFYGDSPVISFQLSNVDSWYADAGFGFLEDILVPRVDNEGNTDYLYDLGNHTLGIRCRVRIKYQDEPDTDLKVIVSDWSEETSIGKNGNQQELAAPTSIEAPVLSQFTINTTVGDDYMGSDIRFFIDIPDSVYEGELYCLAQNMFEPYRIEPQVRVDGGEWIDFYIGNPDWIFSGLRGGSVGDEVNVTENSQVEVRARIVCEQLGLESEWSNIIGNAANVTAAPTSEPETTEDAKPTAKPAEEPVGCKFNPLWIILIVVAVIVVAIVIVVIAKKSKKK